MKRIFTISIALLLVAAFALPSVASAQDNAWHQRDMVLTGGIGIGFYGIYGTSSLPPIFVGFETGVADKITLGGVIGYAGSSEDFGYGKWSYSYIPIEVRGAYHFLEHNPKVDAYAGVGVGYSIVSASVTWSDPAYNNLYGGRYAASASYAIFDIFVGGRYYFSPKFAAFGELGYGIGFVRVGVAYKLN